MNTFVTLARLLNHTYAVGLLAMTLAIGGVLADGVTGDKIIDIGRPGPAATADGTAPRAADAELNLVKSVPILDKADALGVGGL
jgi:hypothetical protein